MAITKVPFVIDDSNIETDQMEDQFYKINLKGKLSGLEDGKRDGLVCKKTKKQIFDNAVR